MTPYYQDGAVTVYAGDVLDVLPSLPSASVQCCVTSPPYWGLRDYGVSGQLGLEATPEAYVESMVRVFREVRRVLRDDGTLWLNLGDSYAAGRSGRDDMDSMPRPRGGHRTDPGYTSVRSAPPGLKPKDLVGIPWRVAFALQADGWYLRSDIIWHKPNPMPESVTDRPTKSHEYIFLLSKRPTYYYDAEAIKESTSGRELFGNSRRLLHDDRNDCERRDMSPNWSRNRRSVWTIATQPYPDAHFATFPEDLVVPCIKAGTSEKGCCGACGAPWVRMVDRSAADFGMGPAECAHQKLAAIQTTVARNRTPTGHTLVKTVSTTTGWRPTCACGRPDLVPCTVLDPFAGSLTALYVAKELGRRAVGVELNPAYIDMGAKRCAQEVLPL